MQTSVEISMYPLKREYKPAIVQFIQRLQSYEELEIRVNSMSTRIFGSYEVVMAALVKEMQPSLASPEAVSMVLKIINKDLRGEPDL